MVGANHTAHPNVATDTAAPTSARRASHRSLFSIAKTVGAPAKVVQKTDGGISPPPRDVCRVDNTATA